MTPGQLSVTPGWQWQLYALWNMLVAAGGWQSVGAWSRFSSFHLVDVVMNQRLISACSFFLVFRSHWWRLVKPPPVLANLTFLSWFGFATASGIMVSWTTQAQKCSTIAIPASFSQTKRVRCGSTFRPGLWLAEQVKFLGGRAAKLIGLIMTFRVAFFRKQNVDSPCVLAKHRIQY